MTMSSFSSIGRVLRAPWQQRRNAGSLWGLGFIVILVMLGPATLLAMSVLTQFDVGIFAAGGPGGTERVASGLRHTAMTTFLFGIAVLVLAWWALFVSNVVEQNRPVLARLVPRHPARLRAALVVAWAGSSAAIVALLGVRLDAPLACAAVTAPALALLAWTVRWPYVWGLGMFAPLGLSAFMHWPGRDAFRDGVMARWSEQPVSITLTLAAAGVVALCALIQTGGRRHVASDAARIRRSQRFQARMRGMQPVAVGKRGVFDDVMTRPYDAWWRLVMARPRASVSSRLMLGLGPGAHWTACAAVVVITAVGVAAAFGLARFLGQFWPMLRELISGMFVGMTIGIVPGVLSPALQAQSRLHQTRREQGLLMLLPGVPRGPTLTRALALRLTVQFLLALAGACLVLPACIAAAHALDGATASSALPGHLAGWVVIGMLPVVAFQWRNWARLDAPSPGLRNLLPLLLATGVVAGVATVTNLGLCSETTAAAVVVAATAAWGALRWRRMGGEPASLPAGRLA